jgi:hypothetical protein
MLDALHETRSSVRHAYLLLRGDIAAAAEMQVPSRWAEEEGQVCCIQSAPDAVVATGSVGACLHCSESSWRVSFRFLLRGGSSPAPRALLSLQPLFPPATVTSAGPYSQSTPC